MAQGVFTFHSAMFQIYNGAYNLLIKKKKVLKNSNGHNF